MLQNEATAQNNDGASQHNLVVERSNLEKTVWSKSPMCICWRCLSIQRATNGHRSGKEGTVCLSFERERPILFVKRRFMKRQDRKSTILKTGQHVAFNGNGSGNGQQLGALLNQTSFQPTIMYCWRCFFWKFARVHGLIPLMLTGPHIFAFRIVCASLHHFRIVSCSLVKRSGCWTMKREIDDLILCWTIARSKGMSLLEICHMTPLLYCFW